MPTATELLPPSVPITLYVHPAPNNALKHQSSGSFAAYTRPEKYRPIQKSQVRAWKNKLELKAKTVEGELSEEGS